MSFSDINWLAIAIATLANMLLAYLFFESRFAAKWKAAAEEQEKGNASDRYWQILAFSVSLALLMWLFARLQSFAEAGFVIVMVLVVAWLLEAAVGFFTAYRVEGSKYRIASWFLYIATFISFLTAIYFMA